MREFTKEEFEKLKIYHDLIRTNQSEKRYKHSLAVAEQASKLANLYGANLMKANTAALLHDIAKEWNPEEQINTIADYISISELQKQNPNLWHSLAGAIYVKNKLKINDEDIFNSIKYHTSGKANMNLLEKIIYVADHSSKDRDYEGVEHIRECAETNLEKAVFISTYNIILLLVNNKMHLSYDTIDAYNYYLTTL